MSVPEIVHLDVTPALAAGFAAAFARAESIIAVVPGYITHELQRGSERPHHDVLSVRRETLAARTGGFRQSAGASNGKRRCTTSMTPFQRLSTASRWP
ncbi:hypothetical protein [Andreprevotia sp. IGB-42]|uniref:hypothetical protein n=1 Tax=Andreprevotia sp. IGB-42 TaxID=2497473 RepID=UPI00191F7E1C|nr:hypothetical protein [Andreprevotia sp. IGB-42]